MLAVETSDFSNSSEFFLPPFFSSSSYTTPGAIYATTTLFKNKDAWQYKGAKVMLKYIFSNYVKILVSWPVWAQLISLSYCLVFLSFPLLIRCLIFLIATCTILSLKVGLLSWPNIPWTFKCRIPCLLPMNEGWKKILCISTKVGVWESCWGVQCWQDCCYCGPLSQDWDLSIGSSPVYAFK